MRVCPTCGEVYGDLTETCRAHDMPLLDWAEASDTHAGVILENTDVERRAAPEAPFELNSVAGEISSSGVRISGPRLEDSQRVHLATDVRRLRAPNRGRVLGGRYQLGEAIGVGGFGAVFAAEDIQFGDRVAVKVLSPAAAQSHELITRFHREAIAASRVRHRHIVDVADFDIDDDGSHYIVMEYLDGRDLSETLRGGEVLEPARALAIAAQCASGLAAAHRAGILHRDLKPANVFLVADEPHPDFVKIIDFGISKLTRTAGHYSDLTSSSKVIGTPVYMSPEQARGADLDGRCDVYGLGVILYEMLTGERPFTGRSPLEILTKHIKAPRVPPSSLRPELAACPGLDELVVKALAARPASRFQSMEDFGEAMLTCLSAIDPHYRQRLFDPEDTTDASPFVAASSELTRPRQAVSGRRRLGVLAGVVGVAATLAVVAWSMARRSDQAMPPAPEPALAEVPAVAPTPAPTPPVAAEPAPLAPEPPPVAAPTHRVHVTSSPDGAAIYRDGERIGATPMDVVIEPDADSAEISLRALGHRSENLTLDRGDESRHVSLKERPSQRPPRAPASVGIEEW